MAILSVPKRLFCNALAPRTMLFITLVAPAFLPITTELSPVERISKLTVPVAFFTIMAGLGLPITVTGLTDTLVIVTSVFGWLPGYVPSLTPSAENAATYPLYVPGVHWL